MVLMPLQIWRCTDRFYDNYYRGCMWMEIAMEMDHHVEKEFMPNLLAVFQRLFLGCVISCTELIAVACFVSNYTFSSVYMPSVCVCVSQTLQ